MAEDRPEHELLFCCARTHVDEVTAERIRVLLQRDVDWTYLQQAAFRHRVLPLVYSTLSTVCPEAVPEPVLEELSDQFHAHVGRNLLLAGELLKLLKLLEKHGISGVPYKGPALAVAAYGDLALRWFSDLDILIHREDFPRVKAALVARGYRAQPQGAPLQLSATQEAVYLRHYPDCSFIPPDGRVTVEIHWAFTSKFFRFQLDPKPLWQRLEYIDLLGSSIPALPAEELLLVLCAHGTKHHWGRLSWICDIAELLRSYPTLNWERVFEQAVALGGERMLLLGLFLAHTLLGSPLPAIAEDRLQADRIVRLLAARVYADLFYDPGIYGDRFVFGHILFHLQARERLRDRLEYILHFLTAPTVHDWALVPLPQRLTFLYYLLRPLRLLGARTVQTWNYPRDRWIAATRQPP